MNISKLKIVSLAVLTATVVSTLSHADAIVDTTDIRQARDVAASDRSAAYKLWMSDVVKQAALDDQISFLDDVRNAEHISGKPLSVQRAEHPFIVTAGELAGLSGASYATHAIAMATIFNGPAANFVTRILQKFPKTAKSAPWVISAAVASYELYKTISHTNMYNEYHNASPDAQKAMYAEKLDSYHALQIDRANQWMKIETANEALSYFDEQLAKKDMKVLHQK